MADVDFRVKFPYKSNVINTPIEITTPEPTFTAINTLVVSDNVPAGTYLLQVSWDWSMPDVNDSAIFRLISPITAGKEYRQEPKDASDAQLRTFSAEYEWSGGPITFDFEGSITVGATTLTIGFSQIIFERKV